MGDRKLLADYQREGEEARERRMEDTVRYSMRRKLYDEIVVQLLASGPRATQTCRELAVLAYERACLAEEFWWERERSPEAIARAQARVSEKLASGEK